MNERFTDWQKALFEKYPNTEFGFNRFGGFVSMGQEGDTNDGDPWFEIRGYEFLDKHPKAPRKTLTHLANGKKNF